VKGGGVGPHAFASISHRIGTVLDLHIAQLQLRERRNALVHRSRPFRERKFSEIFSKSGTFGIAADGRKQKHNEGGKELSSPAFCGR
jgi:hypothetical protein